MAGAEGAGSSREEAPITATELEAAFQKSPDLRAVTLRGGIYTGVKLKKAVAAEMDLRRAVFQRADLSHANLRKADATRAVFTNADLVGADLRGARLEGAVLSVARLRKADLRGAKLSPMTRLDGADVTGMKIDRHALRMLGPELGGMTAAALAEVELHDDQMKLATSFGGFWSRLHLIAILLFVLPYAAFVVRRYWESRTYCENLPCKPLREALLEYIWTGGNPGGGIDLVAITIFCFLLLYNVARFALVFKSNSLELAERAAGFPRQFVLKGWWWLVYHACKWLMFLNLALVAWHTYGFMDTPVRP